MDTKEEPTAARGTSPEAEPERAEDDGDDTATIEEGIEDAEAAAKARELPADQKALQMTPEEYDAIGKEPAQPAPKAAPKSEAKSKS